MEDKKKDSQDKKQKKEEKINDKEIENNKDDIPKEDEDRGSNLSQPIEKLDAEVLNLDNNENINIDLSFKIIVLGNAFVGKSSLVDRATKNRFLEDYNTTIGFDYCSFYIKYDSKIIKLQIWDTCGQEVYQSLITNFYRNSSLAIMVYAINDRESFENIDEWLKELKKESNPDAKIILIGNKKDLESERVVSSEEAKKYAKDFNFISFFETSAKTGLNTKKVFVDAAIKLYEEHNKFKQSESSIDFELSEKGNTIKRNPIKKKGNCC